jgi:hypothetical protein
VEDVRRIMAELRCGFDRARLVRHERMLARNGIAPDGESTVVAVIGAQGEVELTMLRDTVG